MWIITTSEFALFELCSRPLLAPTINDDHRPYCSPSLYRFCKRKFEPDSKCILTLDLSQQPTDSILQYTHALVSTCVRQLTTPFVFVLLQARPLQIILRESSFVLGSGFDITSVQTLLKCVNTYLCSCPFAKHDSRLRIHQDSTSEVRTYLSSFAFGC